MSLVSLFRDQIRTFLDFCFVDIVPPEKIMFVDDSLLANLSLNHQYSDVFECRTSRSNPPLQLIVYRQAKTGEKHFDIHYRTSTIYIDQINSVQFMVEKFN